MNYEQQLDFNLKILELFKFNDFKKLLLYSELLRNQNNMIILRDYLDSWNLSLAI
jgi:hypothetical protein